MKTLIILAIGIVIGYQFGVENVSSIGDAAGVIEEFYQYTVDKVGEYND
jgi:hypothetical protein